MAITPVLHTDEQKFPTIFPGIFGIFYGISKFLYTYSTISYGTPNNFQQSPRILWNPAEETLF